MKKIQVILIMISLLSTLCNSEELKKLYNYNTGLTSKYPFSNGQTLLYVITGKSDGKVKKEIAYYEEYSENNRIIVHIYAEDRERFEELLIFDDSLAFLKGEQLHLQDKMFEDKIAYNRWRATTDKNNKLEYKLLQHDSVKKEIELSFTKNSIIYFTTPIFLRNCLINDITNFEGDIVFVKGVAKSFPAKFKLLDNVEPAKLLATYPDNPEELKELLYREDNLKIYEISLRGIVGLFYKHRFYVAFKGEYPHSFVARWGGEPATAFYCIAINKK